MKFLDLINEELYLTPEQKRQEKKAKTLFKALKNGIIKILHPLDAPGEDHEYIFFRYHIHDNVHYRWENHMGRQVITIVTNTIPGEGVYIETDNEWVMNRIKTKDPIISEHVKYMINSAVKRKFDKFGINIHVSPEGMNFVLKKSDQEPINESEISDSKAELVYKLYQKGILKADRKNYGEISYSYELSDKKLFHNINGKIHVFPHKMTVEFHNEATNKFGILPLMETVKRRFAKFGMVFMGPRNGDQTDRGEESLIVKKWGE